MKTTVLKTVIFLACIIGCYEAEAFDCYKCNSNEHDLCVEEPDKVPLSSKVTDCNGYCTILRTEYTDIPGEVVTLVRDCEKDPLVLNGVRTDKHYTKMYSSCTTNNCNSGDGKIDPSEGDEGRTGPKDVIIVYESDSSWMNKPSYIFTLGAICVYLLH